MANIEEYRGAMSSGEKQASMLVRGCSAFWLLQAAEARRAALSGNRAFHVADAMACIAVAWHIRHGIFSAVFSGGEK